MSAEKGSPLDALPPELRALLPRGPGEELDLAGEVDLQAFSDAYSAWARATGNDVDLITAGMLALRLWRILAARSRSILDKWRPQAPAADEASAASVWDEAEEILDEAFGDHGYTDAVTSGRAQPLEARVRRDASLGRKVTLLELVRALEEVRAEVAQLDARRARLAAAKLRRVTRTRASVVEEDLQADLERVLTMLPTSGEFVPFDDLWRSRVEHAGAFPAILHLAMRRDVLVRQDEDAWPFAPIYVALAPASRAPAREAA